MAKRAPGTSNRRGGHRSGAAGDRGAAGELQRAGEWAAGYADARSDSERQSEPTTITYTNAGPGLISYTVCDREPDAVHSYLNTVPVTISDGGSANRDSNAATPEYGDRRISGPRN